MAKRTRSKTENSAFGQANCFSQAMIPSKADVVRHYFYIRRQEDIKGKRTGTIRDCYMLVVADLEDIWSKFSFPTISTEGTFSKVSRLIEKAYKLNKIPKHRRNDDYWAKIRCFDEMFDICTCNCYDKGKTREECRCDSRIPVLEWDSYVGQKQRINQLGSVDHATTSARRRTAERKQNLDIRQQDLEEESQSSIQHHSDIDMDQEDSDVSESDEYTPDMELKDNIQNRYHYDKLAVTADRFRISCRATAAIVNAALHDMGILNNSNMLDRKKVERERLRVGKMNLEKNHSESFGLECIGFDGRKDNTITSKGYNKEEHYTVVKEPGSAYIDHLTPDNGTSRCIADELLTLLFDKRSNETLHAVLCDGTPVNTGRVGGIIKLIEIQLNRPLQWLICQLHMNELLFKHVFTYIDGNTSGPDTFKGEIGKHINEDLTKLEIVQFTPVRNCQYASPIPIKVINELSSDQKYLYDISIAIQSGVVSKELALRSPGNIHHARWLTRANRILRLYISNSKPSQNLCDLVNIIIKCYVPGWFRIKSHPKATDGAPNFWYISQLVKNVNKKYRSTLESVLQNNSYFATSENILLSMIVDERKHIRSLAADRILKSRNSTFELRNFKLPTTFKIEASDYSEMINWETEDINSPPLLSNVSDIDVIKAVEIPLQISPVPCHSQGVERTVSVVTKASEERYGYEKRHKYILNISESRLNMPSFDWKSQWK